MARTQIRESFVLEITFEIFIGKPAISDSCIQRIG